MTKSKPWRKDAGNREFAPQESQKLQRMRALLEETEKVESREQVMRRSMERKMRKSQEWDLESLKQGKSRKANRSAYSDGSVGSSKSTKAGVESEHSQSIAGQVDSAEADKPAKRPRRERGGKRVQRGRANAAKWEVQRKIDEQVNFINKPSISNADVKEKETAYDKSKDDLIKPGTSYADVVKKRRLRIRKVSASSKKQVSVLKERNSASKDELPLKKFEEFVEYFSRHKREDWNVILRREEEELLNGDPAFLERVIAYDEAIDEKINSRNFAKGYVGDIPKSECPLRIERDYRRKIAEAAYMPPGKRAAATPKRNAGDSEEQSQDEPTGYESSGQDSKSSGNAGGSDGGGGGSDDEPYAAEAADWDLLRTKTGFTCWWNNGAFDENYGLNTYFQRRATVMKQEVNDRIRPEHKEQVEAAYNRRIGEGFRVLGSGPDGGLVGSTLKYTREYLDADYSLLKTKTGRIFDDGSEETFEDCEKTARQAESLLQAMQARERIPEKEQQEVYEAYDRYWTADMFSAAAETGSMASESTVKTHYSRTLAKDWNEMGTMELLSYRTDFTFTPGENGKEQGIPQIEKASIGQLCCGAMLEGQTPAILMQSLGGSELIKQSAKAYAHFTWCVPPAEILDYFFRNGPLPHWTKENLRSIELKPQVQECLARLATPMEGRTVVLESGTVTETYGMNIWRFHFGEASALDIPEDKVEGVKIVFNYLLKLCPFNRLWETLFLGRDLPTEEEVKEQDEIYLSEYTGEWTVFDGIDVKETYGMVVFRHRWHEYPLQSPGIPDYMWPLMTDAFLRRAGDMTMNEAEVFIYKTLPAKKARHEQTTTASTSSAGEEERATSTGGTPMEVDSTSHTTGIAGPTQGQSQAQVGKPQVGQTQGAAFTPMPGSLVFGPSAIPILGMGRETGRDAPWRGNRSPGRFFGQQRPNMIYCRDCRMTHETGKCRRRVFGYGRTGDTGQVTQLQAGVCHWCGGGHETIDCPGPKPQEKEEDYRTCFTCFKKHAQGQCPQEKQVATGQPEQTMRGTPRLASQGTTRTMAKSATAVPKRAFTTSSTSQASTTSVEPPKAPEQGYKPPTKRTMSISQTKQVTPMKEVSQDAVNGMAVGSYLAGHRDVWPELLRKLGQDPVVMKGPIKPVYTIVLAVDGYGVGYLDPKDNQELAEGHTAPLLMQFGDRTTKIGFYFFNGEKRRVWAFVSALDANGQAEPVQPSTMSLSQCIDPTTGRLKANAICVKQELAKEAPSKVMRRVCRVHAFHRTATDKGLTTWQAQVCSADGQGGVPIQVDNEFIIRRCLGFHQGDWAAIDGFKVAKGYPRYSLGGALFMKQVPGSVKAKQGFYVVRLYESDCKQALESFRANWQSGDRATFSTHHRMATEASGAVFHMNSVLSKEKIERGKLQVTKTHFESLGFYRFGVSCAGLEGDDLHEACSIRGSVTVMETKEDKSQVEVMQGLVVRTEFEGDNICAVWVRQILYHDGKKLAELVKEYDIAGAGTTATTEGLEEAREMLKGISMSDGLKANFYQEKIKDRRLTIMGRHTSFVDDAFLSMMPRLANCDISDQAYSRTLTANLNGFQVPRGRNWTAEDLQAEVGRFMPRARDVRYRELQTAGRMLKAISDSSMDEEQKQVVKDMVVNYLPCVNVIAPGGTGKTQTGVNTIALALQRYRSLNVERRMIAVVCPNNDSATAFANRLQELVDCKTLWGMGALLIQSMTQVTSMKTEGPFSMQARARHIIERNYGDRRILELLKDFLDISAKKIQMLFDMTTVVETLIKYDPPEVVIVTVDSLVLNPALWRPCRLVVLEEASRLPDIKIRALMYRMGSVDQVLVLGDPAQQTPFVENPEVLPLTKFGLNSISELIMARAGTIPQVVLTKNRRSVSTLVHCIKQMSPLYAGMVSMVKEPEWNSAIGVPPLVVSDCPIVLLNVSGMHRTSAAAMVSNQEQDSLAAGLVKVLDELNKISGKAKLDVMVATNYNGSKYSIEEQVKGVKFTKNAGVQTVDGAQGKEADRTIWVTGRATPPIDWGSERGDFAKDTRRCTVALGRPREVLYIIGRFDYLTQGVDTPLFNYIMEANKRVPVTDGQWYLQGTQAYLNKVRTAQTAGLEAIYPDVCTFGNGVLFHDFNEGMDEFKQDHIVDCRCNVANGWKNRAWFESAERLVDYVPPLALPFDAELEDADTIAQDEAMNGG